MPLVIDNMVNQSDKVGCISMRTCQDVDNRLTVDKEIAGERAWYPKMLGHLQVQH